MTPNASATQSPKIQVKYHIHALRSVQYSRLPWPRICSTVIGPRMTR